MVSGKQRFAKPRDRGRDDRGLEAARIKDIGIDDMARSSRLGAVDDGGREDVSIAERRLRAFYDLRAREEPDHDPEARLRFRKALAAAELRPGARVLDVGAKRGVLGQSAREIGLDIAYMGADLSAENVALAREVGLDVREIDVTKQLPFPDGAFDCVFCLELLEHLVSPLTLLEEIRRVLRDDGRVVVSVPSPYSWVEVARELFRIHDSEGHLNSFTTPLMENLAALAGFRIERRLGTSVRIPKTTRLIATNSILARSRVYVLRPSITVVFAGRKLTQ
jgi:SAM-dependent methyltransferase